MANDDEKQNDLYEVLGLKKECTDSDLRIAYKKLALRWHPDRCSAKGNSKFVEEAKKKFQAIQQAYSVLSDANKRFLYDVGVYDSDDDGCEMGDFLNEMVAMMDQTKPSENGEESFEKLQELFEDMFNGHNNETYCSTSSSTATAFASYADCSSSSNKRNSSDMSSEKPSKLDDSFDFGSHFQGFSMGTGGTKGKCEEGKGSKRRESRRNNV